MAQVTTYQWDEENRLVGVTRPDGTSEVYEYSGDGQRRTKTVMSDGLSEVTRYIWDNQNILQEIDGAGSVKAHYTDAPGYWGGLTSVRLPGSTPGASGAQFNAATFGSTRFNQASAAADTRSRFYLFDQQASTRQLTDASGNVSDTYTYRAFGEEVLSSATTNNPLRFQGQYGARTDAPAQVDMRARVYDQTTAVWRSPDPIRFSAGDVNLYRFVRNNPVNRIDPSGLSCTCCQSYFAFAWCCDESCFTSTPIITSKPSTIPVTQVPGFGPGDKFGPPPGYKGPPIMVPRNFPNPPPIPIDPLHKEQPILTNPDPGFEPYEPPGKSTDQPTKPCSRSECEDKIDRDQEGGLPCTVDCCNSNPAFSGGWWGCVALCEIADRSFKNAVKSVECGSCRYP